MRGATLRAGAALLAVFLSACGGPGEDAVRFEVVAQPQLTGSCPAEARQAVAQDVRVWVEFESTAAGAGILSACSLDVSASWAVAGQCAVPAVAPADLRLVYALRNEDGTPLFLAVYLLPDVDLTVSGTLTLDFGQGQSRRDFDEDEDGEDNLAEVCAQTDPRADEGG